MRYVWLLAAALSFTTQAHAFQHWTCELLFRVEGPMCSPSQDPIKCRPIVRDSEAVKKIVGPVKLDYAFQKMESGEPDLYLVKGGFGWSDKYTLDEQGKLHVAKDRLSTSTFSRRTYGDTEVVRLIDIGPDSVWTQTFECVEVK